MVNKRLINYSDKVCLECGSVFKPLSGHSIVCHKCSVVHHTKLSKNWRDTHIDIRKEYEKARRPISNLQRRERRSKVQDIWGKSLERGYCRGMVWDLAEKESLHLLYTMGMRDIVRLDYFPHAAFDIVSVDSNGCKCVWQVTTRTHADDVKRHVKLANDLGLNYSIIYFKPTLDGYIIKKGNEVGLEEISLKDLERIQKWIV